MVQKDAFSPQKWSERLGKPYVERGWCNYRKNSIFKMYNSGPGRTGDVVSRKASTSLKQKLGSMLQKRMKHCSGLYMGIIMFLLKDIRDQIEFYEDDREIMSIGGCCERLLFPNWAKQYLDAIFEQDYDFEEFLRVCHDFDKLNFDLDSALLAYKLQGDDAIFSIMCQIFYYDRGRPLVSVCLTPSLPIRWYPDVSRFVSGVCFPVVVSVFPSSMSWIENEEGWFLVDNFGGVLDCAGVGQYSCFSDPLNNRLSFAGRAGQVSEKPYIICWNWLDIVNALKKLDTRNVLVRNLSESLFESNWFMFGLDALLSVYIADGYVLGINNVLKNKERMFDTKKQKEKYTCSLSKEFFAADEREKVVYSDEEIMDWFELGDMCRTE